MTDISEYTIYCTPKQTKKVLELGAPVKTIKSTRTKNTILSEDVIEYDDDTFTYVDCPTSEEMICWIEDSDNTIDSIDVFKVDPFCDNWTFDILDRGLERLVHKAGIQTSRKEATLAAIDAALEYLKQSQINLQ